MNPVLDFRFLLRMIWVTYGDGEFTARDLSDKIRRAIGPFVLSNPWLARLYQRCSRKLISNDLRRLYAMGFLKRRRVKRICRTKSGRLCYRGYEYVYSISSQGKKYLQYLASRKEEDEMLSDTLALAVFSRFPEGQRELAWELSKYIKTLDGKGYRRFSTSRMAFFERIIEVIWKNITDRKVAELERRIRELEEEKKKLERRIRELEKENERCRKALKKADSLLRDYDALLSSLVRLETKDADPARSHLGKAVLP